MAKTVDDPRNDEFFVHKYWVVAQYRPENNDVPTYVVYCIDGTSQSYDNAVDAFTARDNGNTNAVFDDADKQYAKDMAAMQ